MLGGLPGQEGSSLFRGSAATLESEVLMAFAPDVKMAWAGHEILKVLIFENIVFLVLGFAFVGAI